LQLQTLRPYHFRNLQDNSVSFSPGVNVILGKNGQGKTSLVEAIYLLSLSKSFRTSDSQELIRWNEVSASVFGNISGNGIETEIGVSIAEEGKGYYVNTRKVSSISEFLGHFSAVCFSPADLLLLQGPPTNRRKFLDKHIADITPSHMQSLLVYNRALKNKNRILKEGVSSPGTLDAWDKILCGEALKIVSRRKDFVEKLLLHAKQIHGTFCKEDLPLEMKLSSNVKASIDTPEALLEECRKVREREIYTRSSILGPHKDDLKVFLGGKDAGAFASQGQCRSIVLSLTLGVIELIEAHRDDSPVVLLDDVNSELDTERSEAFFSLVLSQKRQIFITGTDASVGHLSGIVGYNVLTVGAGAVSHMEPL